MDDENLKLMSKNSFKRLIKKKVTQATIKFINNERQRHSKTKNLEFKKIKCSEYLKDNRLNTNQMRLLFQLRSRMFPVKCNFKNKFLEDLYCDLCRESTDN